MKYECGNILINEKKIKRKSMHRLGDDDSPPPPLPPEGKTASREDRRGTETCVRLLKMRGCGWGVCNILVYSSHQWRRCVDMIVFSLLWGTKANLCFHCLQSAVATFASQVCVQHLPSPHATKTWNSTVSEVRRRHSSIRTEEETVHCSSAITCFVLCQLKRMLW